MKRQNWLRNKETLTILLSTNKVDIKSLAGS